MEKAAFMDLEDLKSGYLVGKSKDETTMKIKALTKYFPILIGLALLFGASPLEAKITKVADTNIEFIIHTWGGGGLFAIVFNLVSVLLYGSSGWNGIGLIGNGSITQANTYVKMFIPSNATIKYVGQFSTNVNKFTRVAVTTDNKIYG